MFIIHKLIRCKGNLNINPKNIIVMIFKNLLLVKDVLPEVTRALVHA